jgi:hypothetical protein
LDFNRCRYCGVTPAAAAAAECKQCYGYITSAGETCRIKTVDNVCWGAAKLGYCAMRDALVNGYAMNTTTVGHNTNLVVCLKHMHALVAVQLAVVVHVRCCNVGLSLEVWCTFHMCACKQSGYALRRRV